MIKGITFDLDGVYFINGKENFISNLQKLGVPETEARRVFLQSKEMNELYKKGKMTDDEFWSWAIKEWNLKLSVPEIIDLLINGYEVDEKVVDIVKATRKMGYKTLICTNNFPARINGLRKKFGFLDNFDVVIFSYKLEAVKPSKEIFQKLINDSGLKPEEIVFADDDENAVLGAKSVGIIAFLFEGFDKFIKKLNELGIKLS